MTEQTRLIFSYLLYGLFSTLITGAQPKAATGHKMQSLSVVFSTLHCEGYIADLRYRWLIEILSAILKSTRHGGQSTERCIAFGGRTRSPAFTMHNFMSENLRVNIWRDNLDVLVNRAEFHWHF